MRVLRSLTTALLLASVSRLPAQFKPFSLPWDDATATATDFSGLSLAPAGSRGRIEADAAGHLVVNGRRERILGVNITAAAAFPPKAKADAIAARLAKFGVNAVRFHHLEAPWQPTQVLIDYRVIGSTPVGRSRQLHAERLDRLQYFISRLTAHGIYTNLNLLVSRQFFADDGLPAEIETLDWKSQHVLSFFNDDFVALQKEHARNLLTAPNPSSGVTLAADPAVAFVEILNENGIFQNWHDGTLDRLPAVFAQQLRTRWNTWLQGKYASTAAMLAAWGAVDEALGSNLLQNADFAAGTDKWNLEQHDTALVTGTKTTDFTGGAPALKLDITRAGSAGWNVQFNQSGLGLTAGRIYTVSFSAKASAPLPFSADLTRTGPTDYGSVQSLASGNLTTSWQRFSVSFIAGTTEASVRLNFGNLGDRVGTYWLADVRFSTGGSAGALPAGSSLEIRTVPTVPKTGTAVLPAQKLDWVRCLLDLERTYWRTMRDYLKQDLGYRGLVFGSIISNTPPGVQAELDLIDSHTYWQHPVFPGGAWDSVNWTVSNVSMVNTLDNVLGNIARQRVRGRPHMVTEYQHAQPNTYGAEGPLLAAAYGALQDWDGLWLFAYGSNADNWDRGYVDDFFNIDTHPTKLANLLIAANLFRRLDVASARHELTVKFDDATQLDVVANRGSAWSVGDASHLGLSGRHALVNRVNLQTGATAGGLAALPAAPDGTVLAADTGELHWDLSKSSQGVVTVDTPRTKSVIGFVSGRTFDLGGWRFAPGTTTQDWLTASLTTLSGISLDHAGGSRSLLVLTGNLENTGQQWTDATKSSVGANWGRAPVLVEIVPLTLTVPFPASRVSAWSLDARGARLAALTVADAGNQQSRLIFGSSGDTLWYELVIAADPSGRAPTIAQEPTAAHVAPGAPFRLAVVADGVPAPDYTWRRDGTALPAFTGPELRIDAATTADAGTYTVEVKNSVGTATSRSARVVVGTGDRSALQLVNLSTRAASLSGEGVFITGFVIRGTGRKDVLIRALGPRLAEYGLTGTLADPRFDLAPAGASSVLINDDWDASLAPLFTRLGANSLTAGSRDAAARIALGAGAYTAIVSGATGGTGTTLAELYDAGNEPGATARLVNISTRGPIATGDDVVIAGFVITGSAPKQVLIRAIGPSLTPLGVTTALADPYLRLVRLVEAQSPTVAANDDWWADPDHLAAQRAMSTVGAFALAPTSKDAAILVTLEPGVYTAIVNGVKGDTGVALVEVYETD